MIIQNVKEEFFRIIHDSNIFIIASINVDSLSTVKILTSILSSENVKYALSTVDSREALFESIDANKKNYKYFVLINCGGNFNLTTLSSGDDELVIFIMDNHRPYSVQNIYSAETIRLIINNNENLEDVPQFETLFESVCSDNTPASNKQSDTIEKKYERFFYHGSPSAITMFDITSKLGKDILEYVWFALCGLTELFILRKLTREKYICDMMYLQQQVLRLSNSNNDPSACFSITSDIVLQIYFYTHWSLMESLQASPLTSSHFQIWSINGGKRLFSFLADMGIPLSQCKQSFASMESDIRNSSKDLIMKHSTKYGLHDISYPSFVAQFGYRCKITAADYVLTLISAIDYCNKDQENRSSSFLSALEILNILNVSRLEKQIQVAKSMLSSIATNVGYFVDLHYIICAGPFLFGAATEDREQNRFISNPLILDILSYYALLSHSTLTKSKRAKELPFVLTIPISETENSVIVGIPSVSSLNLLNDLHVYFQKAIEVSQISVIKNGFCPSQIVIKTADRTAFFDALVTVMGSSPLIF